MRFVVDSEIWERFPGLRIVLVWGEGIDNRAERPAIERALAEAMGALTNGWSWPNPQSHPHIAAWREAIKETGFSGKKFPSSIEALTRRVVGGKGLGTINPLVDAYNVVSLRHLVPAGGWDLDDLETRGGDLRLCLAEGTESFHAIGADEPVGVEPGEAAYVVGDQVVTRHFVWRQSELGKLTGATRRALLISECLAAVDDRTCRRVLADLEGGLRDGFGVATRGRVVTADAADESGRCRVEIDRLGGAHAPGS